MCCFVTGKFDAVFEDGALYKYGNVGQGIYIDPEREFVGVYFSTNGYPPYGECRVFCVEQRKYWRANNEP